MDKFEFGRELDCYISKLRAPKGSSFFKGFFAKRQIFKAQNVKEHIKEPLPQTVKMSEPIEVPMSSDDKNNASKEYDSDKKSVFSKIVDWVVVGVPEKHDANLDVEVESVLAQKEMVDDLREVARISIANFRNLPAHKIRTFKESQDYLKFKNILKKHGLSRD